MKWMRIEELSKSLRKSKSWGVQFYGIGHQGEYKSNEGYNIENHPKISTPKAQLSQRRERQALGGGRVGEIPRLFALRDKSGGKDCGFGLCFDDCGESGAGEEVEREDGGLYSR